MLAELEPLAAAATEPAQAEKLTACLTYLQNNAPRMRYDLYRREGLPITTPETSPRSNKSYRRMKETKKFWDQGGEPQLQLCADRLSDTDPLKTFWIRRARSQTGLRNRCAKT